MHSPSDPTPTAAALCAREKKEGGKEMKILKKNEE